MKKRLVLGLGNPLAGDDGIAPAIADALWQNPRLPDDVEVLVGGTDLLRFADHFSGRTDVYLVDALLEKPAAEPVLFLANSTAAFDDVQVDAHHLSAPAALELLLTLNPDLAAITFTWCLIPIASVSGRTGLSREAQAQIGPIVAAILARLGVPLLSADDEL
jgi:hydrogenase maturation protease